MRTWRASTSPAKGSSALPDASFPSSRGSGRGGLLRRLLSQHRGMVAGALALISALGWFYLVAAPMPMPGAAGVWSPAYLALSFLMWFVMMVAMMTPLVAPSVLLYDRVTWAFDPVSPLALHLESPNGSTKLVGLSLT